MDFRYGNRRFRMWLQAIVTEKNFGEKQVLRESHQESKVSRRAERLGRDDSLPHHEWEYSHRIRGNPHGRRRHLPHEGNRRISSNRIGKFSNGLLILGTPKNARGTESLVASADPNSSDVREMSKAGTAGFPQFVQINRNKEHWNGVILDGTVPEREILMWISQSYDLTKPGRKLKSS